MMKTKSISAFWILALIIAGILIAITVKAWTNPSQNPPGGGGALYYSNGNVGIGTTTPDYPLTVNGRINASAGLCIAGTCWTSLPSLPSGNTNYVAKFTGTNTLGNSQISDDGTNVNLGVGGSSLLNVTGGIAVNGTSGNFGVSGAGQGRIYFDSSANKFKVSENGGAYVNLIGGGGGGSILFPDGTSGTTRNISLGTYVVPSAKTLYILSAYNSAAGAQQCLTIGGTNAYCLGADSSVNFESPFVVAGGTALGITGGTGIRVAGIEVATGVSVKNLNLSTSYTVTSGKTLYILTMYTANSAVYLQIGGSNYLKPFGAVSGSTSFVSPVVVPGGSSVGPSSGNTIYLTGYEQ